MLLIEPPIEVDTFLSRVRTKLGVSNDAKVKFMDDEDEKIQIIDQEDMNAAIAQSLGEAKQRGIEIGKMEVWIDGT